MAQSFQERDFGGTPYVPVYVMLPVSLLILLLSSSEGLLTSTL